MRLIVFIVAVLWISSAAQAQQKMTFGPNKGQPILTQNELDEVRAQRVVEAVNTLSTQVKASNDTNTQILMELLKLQTEANKQIIGLLSQQAARPASIASTAVTPTYAPASKTPQNLPANASSSSPEVLSLQRTMIARIEDQNNMLKLTNTLLAKMAEEQKWSNSLMQSLIEGKKN